MAGFAINPPNEKLVDQNGYATSSWYRFFSRVQGAIGGDAVALMQAAPVLTYSPTAAFSADKVLTAGAGMSFTSGASTFTIALTVTGVTAAAYGSASQVASFTVDQYGRLSAAGNVTITPSAIGAVPTSRSLTAGAGLTGGGDLSSDRIFDVGAGAGITVNANDVALDTASTRNVDHAAVTFTAGAGLTGGGTLEASRTFDVGAGAGIAVSANDVALDTASTRNTDHASITLTAGAGLTGGGDISASRTFDVVAGTGITVNANDVALSDMTQATVKGRAAGAGTGAPTDLSAAQLVTIINTADGTGSGLDADLLDGMNTSASGDRWGVIPFIATDGVIEVGRYIDFHNSDADAGDNAVRLDTGGGTTDLYINGNIIARSGSTTVAGLPAAGTVGRRGFVTDATATTFASIVAGGGANGVPVYDDGVNWRIG